MGPVCGVICVCDAKIHLCVRVCLRMYVCVRVCVCGVDVRMYVCVCV